MVITKYFLAILVITGMTGLTSISAAAQTGYEGFNNAEVSFECIHPAFKLFLQSNDGSLRNSNLFCHPSLTDTHAQSRLG